MDSLSLTYTILSLSFWLLATIAVFILSYHEKMNTKPLGKRTKRLFEAAELKLRGSWILKIPIKYIELTFKISCILGIIIFILFLIRNA